MNVSHRALLQVSSGRAAHPNDEEALNLSRRRFLRLATAPIAVPFMTRSASAQAYPSRPVRLISGFAAGGPNDLFARLIGQWLSERLGQPFLIENRAGAGGNIGAEAVVRAAPDGYTLLEAALPNAVNATLYDNLPFNFVRDIAPVASVARFPSVMVVNPAVPARSIAEFIRYAKANPGKINMGSGGNGSSGHIYGELFKMMTGVDLVHVPYRGGAPALADLFAGRLQVIFDTVPTSIPYIAAGTLRPLAVTTAARLQVLPDVPALAESVPGYEAIGWQGIVAPRNTPAPIVDRLNEAVNAALADSKNNAQLADLGATVFASSAADFGKFIAEDTEKWAAVIRAAKIKPN
jgi:tripartite-type tricarboxylate transporter receptor subunit TctC